MTDLRRLTTTRSAHRGQMTKLLNRVDEVRDGFADPPLAAQKQTFQAILDSMITKFGHLKSLDDQLLDATETDDLSEAIEEADDYLNELNIKIEVHRSFSKFLLSVTKEAHTHLPTGGTTKSKVNLPKLQLPKFDGNFLKWTGFIDAFASAVDKDSSLENIQKFQYLIAQLTGEAAKTIEGLQLTNANYHEALELLQGRYGQPHKLIACYMKALWELPKPTNNIDSIRVFYDDLESYIRGLRSLGKTEDSYGDLLVPIVFEKLPGHIKQHISREHGDTAWTIQELKASLYREIQAAQAGRTDLVENGTNLTHAAQDGHNPYIVENGANLTSTTSAFHVGAAASGTREPRAIICAFCKGAHWHTNCVVVADTDTRRDIAKHNSLCFNCLRAKHRVHDCISKSRCHNCGQKHHTALCYKSERNAEGTNTHTENENTPSTEGHTDPTHRLLTPTSCPVLLKTAVATISTTTEKAIVNILFDEGSQRSFMTSNVAHKLGIHITDCDRENLQLSTFGSQTTGVQSVPVTDFTLLTREDSVHIRAIIVPTISSPVKNYTPATIENYAYLRDLSLADHVKADIFDIDILVGADYYWSIVNNEIVRGPGPTAVHTKLGYLISGPSNLQGDVSVFTTTCLKVMVDTHDDTTKLANYWDLETIEIHDDVTAVNKKCQFEQFRDENLKRTGRG
jgi:hypothetical protein